jgi:hypothetical protein
MRLLPRVCCYTIVLLTFTHPLSNAQESPLLWTSTHIEVAPTLDGEMESLWSRAKPLPVIVREAFGGGTPITVMLYALHTDDAFYVLARWADSTRSDRRDPYLWNRDSNSYERPTTPDDQFALEFPLEGVFQVSMLPAQGSYTTDVWHWKAGRSNLGGWVDDKRHLISTTPIENALVYELGGYNTVYISRPMDSGTASYYVVPPPEAYSADAVASFAPQEPSGSLTDVRGKGLHDGQNWSLEMGCRFVTGNDDDRQLDPSQAVPCAIAVLNDELYWAHSVSQELLLQFAPASSR